MALTPDTTVVPDIFESEDMPSRTYEMDWINGRILSKKIDGREAIKQFVFKTLFDPRFTLIIYSDDYGNEIQEVLEAGYTDEAVETELTRAIREALIYDERITGVDSFKFERVDDKLLVDFRVLTAEGEIILPGVDLGV